MANQRPPGVSRQMVLDHLIANADYYGVVELSHRIIGEAIGLSRVAVLDHLNILEKQKIITVEHRHHAINRIQLRADLY